MDNKQVSPYTVNRGLSLVKIYSYIIGIKADREKIMNKNYLINDGIITLIDFVTVSSKGKKSINKKNTYLLNLVVKALSLKKIGCNFVVDTEYKNDTVRLSNNTTCKNSRYDKNSNTINQKDVVNVLNLVNLFLEDRQLLARHNDKNNLIIQVVKSDAKLILGKSLFKRDKNSSIVTTVTSYDLVTDKEVEEDEKVKSSLAFLTEEDVKKALANFNACNGVLENSKGEKVNFTSYLVKTLKDYEEEEKNEKTA